VSIDREESLFLTVSEDHTRREYPQYILLMSRPYSRAGGMIAAYEGAMLGGADRFFGLDELNLWLRRHRYAAFDMHLLIPIVRLCLEYAVRCRLVGERPGIAVMAEGAARELLEHDPLRLRHSSRGWLQIYWLKRQHPAVTGTESEKVLGQFAGFEDVLALFTELLEGSAACADARSLVEQGVLLYKKVYVRYVAPDHSSDPLPLGEVSEEELWEGDHPAPEQELLPEPEKVEEELVYERSAAAAPDELLLSEQALAAVPDYLAKNFGPSFKTAKNMEELEGAVCTGIHEGRRLLLTDGLPEEAYEGSEARAVSLRASREANLQMLADHEAAARQGRRSIAQAFQNALNLKNEPEVYRADRGTLVNSALWKVGRCEEPRLFDKIFRQDNSTVVVELLIDASGSQSVRQSMVALQSYLFSAALSDIKIPHRVMSYCTYGDHTVLRRFRDYDDSPGADRKILEYRATANNRDGLALAAAGVDLLRRREEHKIVIIVSDGLPNDMVSGRKRANAPVKYVGEAAVRDTCEQVRRLRRAGVHVMGVFLGDDGELENERLIYGSSFLRIRRAEDLGGSAGKRLSETLLLL